MSVTFRDATGSEFTAFFGKKPDMTVRAKVAVNEDGKVVAIGGYYIVGRTTPKRYPRKIAFEERMF